MRPRVKSAYELLESKLGVEIRLLGGVMFILLRLVWMALLVYLSAKAMTVMLGVGDGWIPVITIITGFVAVIYTSLGGLRAVVITDTVQTLLMLGGAILVIVMITLRVFRLTIYTNDSLTRVKVIINIPTQRRGGQYCRSLVG